MMPKYTVFAEVDLDIMVRVTGGSGEYLVDFSMDDGFQLIQEQSKTRETAEFHFAANSFDELLFPEGTITVTDMAEEWAQRIVMPSFTIQVWTTI